MQAVAGIAAESGQRPSAIMEWTEPELALVIAFRRLQHKVTEAARNGRS